MNFLEPIWLWALPAAVFITMFCWISGDWKRRKVLREYLDGGAQTVISYRKRYVRRALLLFAILMLVLAAARPHWGARPLDSLFLL